MCDKPCCGPCGPTCCVPCRVNPTCWPPACCQEGLARCCEHLVHVQAAACSVPACMPCVGQPLEIHSPTMMSNCDERKYHIPGYTGYIPRLKFNNDFKTYSLAVHEALNDCSWRYYGICKTPCCCPCPGFKSVRHWPAYCKPKC